MAVPSMVKFVIWSMFAVALGTAQSSPNRRPNIGFEFPETDSNSQNCITREGTAGSCIPISECKKDIDYQRGVLPELCYWQGNNPIVCCLRNIKAQAVPDTDNGDHISDSDGCGKRIVPKDASRVPQVAGGWISQPSAWPWMIAILRSNLGIESFLCGGTMISVRYILTAAHCFGRDGTDQRRIPVARFIIRVGSNANNEGIAHRLRRIIIHDDYKIGRHYNDIATLEVSEPITLSDSVQPICLPSSGLQGRRMVGREVVVIGWGDQSFGGIRDNKLREVNISVIDREECNRSYSTLSSRAIPSGVTSQFLCAGDLKGGKDACQADSGGPLMMPSSSEWTIVGIVSFGYGCAQRGFPGVYTQVSSYLRWIEDKTGL